MNWWQKVLFILVYPFVFVAVMLFFGAAYVAVWRDRVRCLVHEALDAVEAKGE